MADPHFEGDVKRRVAQLSKKFSTGVADKVPPEKPPKPSKKTENKPQERPTIPPKSPLTPQQGLSPRDEGHSADKVTPSAADQTPTQLNIREDVPASTTDTRTDDAECPPVPPRSLRTLQGQAPGGNDSSGNKQIPSTADDSSPQLNKRDDVPTSTIDTRNDNEEYPPVPPRLLRTLQQEQSLSEEDSSTRKETHSTADDSSTQLNSGDCKIQVTGFNKSVPEEALKLYFENQKKSGGGPVDSVSIIDGAAVVHFKHASDAENVAQKTHTYGGQSLEVIMYSSCESKLKNTFVFTGLSTKTTPDMLTDFLESKTCCSVLSVQECSEKGEVLVVFGEDHFPEYDDLQGVCKRYPLDGSTLSVVLYEPEVKYLEPIHEDEISVSITQMTYIEEYNKEHIQKEMDKLNVNLTFDKETFKLRLRGKNVQKAVGCVNAFLKDKPESEYQISMPGIVNFLKSSEAQGKVASIEREHMCIIVTHEGTYEVIQACSERCSIVSSGTESEDSGGSHKGKKNSVDASPHKEDVKPDVTREFQILTCRLVLTTGKVMLEKSDCLVNITQDDFKNGDIWSSLSANVQEELSRHLEMPNNRDQWKKTGIVMTYVSGLPCKYILHVSQKHVKGDLVKVVIKCLQTANSVQVSSVAFFSMLSRVSRWDSSMEDSPRSFVEAVNKYQKAAKSSITCVRLVLKNMAPSVATVLEEEVEKLLNRQTGGFFFGKFGPRKQSRTTIKIISASPMTSSTQEPEKPHEEEVAMYPVIKADASVYICSTNVDTNITAFDKLKAFCEESMPPRKVKDARIKRLSKDDVKRLRSRKVELDIDISGGRIELRGFPADVDVVYTKLTDILENIPVPESTSLPQTDKEEGRESTTGAENDDVFQTGKGSRPVGRGRVDDEKPDDDDGIFGKFVASELRDIPEEKEKRKVKYHIKKLLMDVHAKYMAE